MQKLAKEYQYLSRPIEELIRGQQCEPGDVRYPPQDQITGSGYIELSPIEWTGKWFNYAAICNSFL